jgi:hypothetical protein
MAATWFDKLGVEWFSEVFDRPAIISDRRGHDSGRQRRPV